MDYNIQMSVQIIQDNTQKKKNIYSITNIFVWFRSRQKKVQFPSTVTKLFRLFPPPPSTKHLNICSALRHSDSSLINQWCLLSPGGAFINATQSKHLAQAIFHPSQDEFSQRRSKHLPSPSRWAHCWSRMIDCAAPWRLRTGTRLGLRFHSCKRSRC